MRYRVNREGEKSFTGEIMGKKRVKCANCGMIYDIWMNDIACQYPPIIGECPKCKSNAFNVIPEVWKQGT